MNTFKSNGDFDDVQYMLNQSNRRNQFNHMLTHIALSNLKFRTKRIKTHLNDNGSDKK